MKKNKKTYTPEFKSRLAIEAYKERYAVSDIASTYLVHESLVRAWRQRFSSSVTAFFSSGGAEHGETSELEALEQRINELRAEQEWMSAVAAKALDLHARRELVEPAKTEEDLSILRKSRLLGLHRSGVYYQRHKDEAARTQTGNDAGKEEQE